MLKLKYSLSAFLLVLKSSVNACHHCGCHVMDKFNCYEFKHHNALLKCPIAHGHINPRQAVRAQLYVHALIGVQVVKEK
jgi:hypothetical protein